MGDKCAIIEKVDIDGLRAIDSDYWAGGSGAIDVQ